MRNQSTERGMTLWLVALVLGATAGYGADDLESQLKAMGAKKKAKTLALVEKNKEAIVEVQFVVNIKIKVGAQEAPARDQKVSLNGTMLNADGLTVVSNAAADPEKQMEMQIRRNPRYRNAEVDVQTAINEVKIILNDGTEVEAEIAIRDEDLSVMLVNPKEKPEKPYPFVSLDANCAPQQLDTVVSIARMNIDAGRTALVLSGMVRGIIKKPRKYYVAMSAGAGLPAFDKDGKCFGIFLPRKSASGMAVGSQFVLPAEDVLEVIEQIKKKEK